MTREEFDPDEVTLDDMRDMNEGEFRMWTFLRINEIHDKLSNVEGRQWFILSGIIITILLIIMRTLA